ncbi:outer membrane lipoprotein-sorting protein [Thorsellia kenyensis]|uniref:Outer membrane lipoprotein-sorting protein n=1 Tax=Thorsellia kenyensis TaxID=1549888 RepID=A0ABV6CBA4_9GAMM
MKKFYFKQVLIFTFSVCIFQWANANLTKNDELTASDIIKAADRIRAPDQPFRYTLNLTEHAAGKVVNQQKLDVSMRFIKPDEVQDGDARALVRFVEPVRDRGKALFSDINQMWYFAPSLRRPIQISKQQRLIGQVANGDVVASDMDFSYNSEIISEEMCDQVQCYKLSLTRKNPSVTYPKITYFVEKDTFRPFKSEFYSESGVLLKRAIYENFTPVLGTNRPTRIIVEDGLKKDSYTIMDYSNVAYESLPESYFQKDYLLRLN